MGFFKWLGNGVRAVNNFFDSLYMRLPSTVRGLLFGFSVVVTVAAFIFFLPANILDYLYKLLFGFGR